MNISPITNVKYVSSYSNKPREKKPVYCDNVVNKTAYPPLLYFSGIKTHDKFGYNPVSSMKPVFGKVDCDYSNFDEFSALFARKLNSQLMPVSKQDIVALIASLKEKTKAPEDLIREVLYKLTLYSSYNSLDEIEKFANHNNVDAFDYDLPDTIFSNTIFDTSLNKLLEYLNYYKKQIDLNFSPRNSGPAYVIDEGFLRTIDKMMKLKGNQGEVFSKLLFNSKVKFFNLPGWEIKCSDDKTRSANLFYGNGFLKDLALDTIKRVQKGEDLDDIIYAKPVVSRLVDLAQKQTGQTPEIIKIPIKESKYTVDDIYENLKVKTLSKKDITAITEKYLQNIEMNTSRYVENPNYESLKKSLAKYIDKRAIIYSPTSLALELKTLHRKIVQSLKKEGYSEKDIIYVVPDDTKSNAYITSVYARVNDIDENNIIHFENYSNWTRFDLSQKPKVILDDISASGITQINNCDALRNAIADMQPDRAPIYYGCLVFNNERSSKEKNFAADKTCYNHKLYSFDEIIKKDNDFNNVNDLLLYSGYRNIASCCFFPYMLPDNNNDYFSILCSGLLHKNTKEANKSMKFSYDLNRGFYKEFFSDLTQGWDNCL